MTTIVKNSQYLVYIFNVSVDLKFALELMFFFLFGAYYFKIFLWLLQDMPLHQFACS